MSPCTVDARERIRVAAALLDAHPRCAGVDALDPHTGPHDRWTLEATLDADACPPGVLRALATERLHVQEARPRGTGYHVVARV